MMYRLQRRNILRIKSCCITQRLLNTWTVEEAYNDVRNQLQQCGRNPNDASILIASVLPDSLKSSSPIFMHFKSMLTADQLKEIQAKVNRRCEGEPIAYIVGKKEFWSMNFKVTNDTLIPRADSEILIETLVNHYAKHAPLQILDVCTGSGCLLLAALSEFPNASGVGIDISPKALAVAKENAKHHHVLDRADFIQQDIFKPIPLSLKQQYRRQYDIIICNPPYIPKADLHLVAPDVLKYEPHIALFADIEYQSNTNSVVKSTDENGITEDDRLGLHLYHALSNIIPHAIRSSQSWHESERIPRSIILEIGSKEQAHAVRDILTTTLKPFIQLKLGLQFKSFLKDIENRYRGVHFQDI